MLLGISLLEDVPQSYGIDEPSEQVRRYLEPRVKGNLEPNQKHETTPISKLRFNNNQKVRILRLLGEENDEIGERATDVDDFDLNGDPVKYFDSFKQRIPWDPDPEDLGSNDPTTIMEAFHQYSRRVRQQIQQGETIDRPPLYLKALFTEGEITRLLTTQNQNTNARQLPSHPMITCNQDGPSPSATAIATLCAAMQVPPYHVQNRPHQLQQRVNMIQPQ